MESLEHTPMQYAYLQPLKISDETNDDDDEDHEGLDLNCSIEGPALTPIKEEIVSRDLRSYFLGKGKLLFDEPDGLPVIWVEVPRDDFVMMKKKKKPRKPTKPSARSSSSSSSQKKQRRPKPKKKSLERTVPCQSCDRKFVTLRHMKIHAATHMKNKNKCFVCRRKFSHGGALWGHMRSHNKLSSVARK